MLGVQRPDDGVGGGAGGTLGGMPLGVMNERGGNHHAGGRDMSGATLISDGIGFRPSLRGGAGGGGAGGIGDPRGGPGNPQQLGSPSPASSFHFMGGQPIISSPYAYSSISGAAGGGGGPGSTLFDGAGNAPVHAGFGAAGMDGRGGGPAGGGGGDGSGEREREREAVCSHLVIL